MSKRKKRDKAAQGPQTADQAQQQPGQGPALDEVAQQPLGVVEQSSGRPHPQDRLSGAGLLARLAGRLPPLLFKPGGVGHRGTMNIGIRILLATIGFSFVTVRPASALDQPETSPIAARSSRRLSPRSSYR